MRVYSIDSNSRSNIECFLVSQNQIFELMQNDIYPRFLNTSEYKDLIAHSRDSASGGRGFFAKFKVYSTYAGGRRLKAQAAPEEFTSPCLPQRFTKRHVRVEEANSSRLCYPHTACPLL